MYSHIDVTKAVELLNDKKTTVDDMCKFVYSDIQSFQISRENFYMDEFKREFEGASISDKEALAKTETDKMVNKIKKEVRRHSLEYAAKSIDMILDAMNDKRFKTKKQPKTFLTVLCTLKEMNE